MVKCYAVMGNPVAHSLSPMIHELFAEQTKCRLRYEKILVDESLFEQQVRQFFAGGGEGLNITLPFKQQAYAIAKIVTPRCQEAKAANTLWMQNNKLHADNTDGIGLLRDLKHYIDLHSRSILLLGAGGAARGVIGPLLEARPSSLTIANRTVAKADALKAEFTSFENPPVKSCGIAALNGSYDVVINTTSASTHGDVLLLPDTLMATKPFCYDLAYEASNLTGFVAWAQTRGAVAVDGLGMLVEQAAESFLLWHNLRPNTQPVIEAVRKRLRI